MNLSLHSIMLVISAAFMITAVVLMLLDGFKRRVGDAPYCAACHYNLTGIESERCPECGARLYSFNIVIGKPPSRRRFRLAVLFVMASCALSIATNFSNSQSLFLYKYLPDPLLVKFAQWHDIDALMQLYIRCIASKIDPNDLLPLAPTAVQAHSSIIPPDDLLYWTEILAELDAADLLTPPQRLSFYDNAVRFRLSTPATIRAGQNLEVAIDCSTRGSPSADVSYQLVDCRLKLGDLEKPVLSVWHDDLNAVSSNASPLISIGGPSMSLNFEVGRLEPGDYSLKLLGRKEFLRGANSDWSNPDINCELSLEAPLTILPADAPPDQGDPVLAEQFKKLIKISTLHPDDPNDPLSDHFQVQVVVNDKPPFAAKFELLALSNEREIKLGSFDVEPTTNRFTYTVYVSYADFDSESFVPVLRHLVTTVEQSQPDARRCADIHFPPIIPPLRP